MERPPSFPTILLHRCRRPVGRKGTLARIFLMCKHDSGQLVAARQCPRGELFARALVEIGPLECRIPCRRRYRAAAPPAKLHGASPSCHTSHILLSPTPTPRPHPPLSPTD